MYLWLGDGFVVGARQGLHKLFMASVKRQICLGLHFLLSVSLTAHPFQMRSVWAGYSGLPVCLTAGLRMWIIATPKLKHAADLWQSISHYSTTPMLQSGTCSTFLPQGETMTDIINTEMDQVSEMWLLSQCLLCWKQQQTVRLIWSFGAAERRDETRNIKCSAQSPEHTGNSLKKKKNNMLQE